jgi:RHS repeat-associated protein
MAGHRPHDWHVLDLDKDPTPGDPHRVRQLAKHLHDFADDVSDALRLVKGMADEDTLLEWAGKSAEVFKDEFSGVPKNLQKLKKSYQMCGDALADFWPKLERAQALADKALAKAREARDNLSSAQSRLSSADSWVTRATKEADKYKDDPTGAKSDADKPDEGKVRAATRDVQHAKSAHSKAQSDVSDAQDALAAAKKMAEDARQMREEAARDAKAKIEEASDAGIQNRSWWEEVGDWFTDNWDSIVAVCKVVVAVVGVVAMIIGGPILAAIVVVAAAVVLADTLYKYSKGQASLWDVAFAALDCIPGGKGITTLGKLAKGMKGLAKGGLKAMAKGLGKRGLRKEADNALAKSKPPKGRCKNGDPVDMISGEMLMTATDVLLSGVLRLGVARTHVSTYRGGRWFGPSWTSTLDQRLELDDEGVLFATEDGMILVYPVPPGGGDVMPLEGPRWPLAWDDERPGAMRVTDPMSGITRHFAPVESPEHDTTFTLPIQTLSDRNGNRVDFEYGTNGRPVALRHSGGYHVAVDSTDDRVAGLRLIGPGSEQTVLVRYAYDNGRLTEVRNSTGLPYRYTYDAEDRITSWTDRTGSWYRYSYDEADRVIRGEGVDGILSCSIAYDTEARTTRYTDSLGRTTTYRYNDRLQLVSSTNPLGQTLTNNWDRHDRLLSQTDALGRTTRYGYDSAGNLARIIRPDGAVSEAQYDASHQLVQAVLPSGAVWRYSYDGLGNHIATVGPSGAVTRYEYDQAGGLVAVTDAAGRTSRARCNAAGLPVEFTDAQGAVSRIERDSFGRVSAFTDALGRTTRLRTTVEGRTVWRQAPDGSEESWTWDAEGNLLSQTDRLGRTTTFEVGPLGQVASRRLPDGSSHSFTYDTELNLLGVTDPRSNTWRYVYDAANHLMSETDFGGRTLTYGRDAMGALVSRVNGAGETVVFVRDELGRVTEAQYDGVSAHYTYDTAGHLIRETGPDVTVERTYDMDGLLLVESINGRTTTFEYDALGRRIRRRTPTGIESTWTYDDTGRPSALETDGRRITFGFDDRNRETARFLPGGVTLSQSWDDLDRLSVQRLARASADNADEVLLQQRAYTYRPDGVPTSVDELTSGPRLYTLDTRGRVTAMDARGWQERYQYDELGNLTWASTPATEDDEASRVFTGTRIQRRGRTHYERDAEGRIIRIVHRLLNGRRRVRTYAWNSRSQLVAATTPEGVRWHYVYDPAGRRVAKRRLGTDGSVAEEIRFAWDGTRLAEQVMCDGRSTTWDYAPGSHQPIAQIDRTAPDVEARFQAIVADLSGAPAELVSAEGEVVWQQRTTLWGSRLPDGLQADGGDGTDCPLRFPGQYADDETGWHYNFRRHYDPLTAQYASPDPLGLAPASNDSAYVSNPYKWSDPLGLWWQDPNNNNRFGRDPNLPEGDREYTRDNQYPSGYRTSTHDYMVENYTDEGRAISGVPRDDDGQRIPRDQLTWRNGNDEVIWNPRGNNPEPFHRTVTYEHLDPVVQHWNREGRFTDRATRNDFYNNTDHLEPMEWRENSRGGGRMTETFIQEVGEGYSCD